MSDVSITAGSVLPGSDADVRTGVAGEAITAGQVVYLSAASTYSLADCNSATAAVRNSAGIALNSAATGQPVVVIVGGTYTAGGTLVAGKVYVLSATAGGIAPVADLASGWYTSILGWATTTSVLKVSISNTGVVN